MDSERFNLKMYLLNLTVLELKYFEYIIVEVKESSAGHNRNRGIIET